MSYEEQVTCPDCDGTGIIGLVDEQCDRCSGSGMIWITIWSSEDAHEEEVQ